MASGREKLSKKGMESRWWALEKIGRALTVVHSILQKLKPKKCFISRGWGVGGGGGEQLFIAKDQARAVNFKYQL